VISTAQLYRTGCGARQEINQLLAAAHLLKTVGSVRGTKIYATIAAWAVQPVAKRHICRRNNSKKKISPSVISPHLFQTSN
jgi:hypothetical protein